MIKSKKNLLLEPSEHKFENHGVFNPACIVVNGKIHPLYRATSKRNCSTIGYCRMESPVKISERNDKLLLIPKEKYESQGADSGRIEKFIAENPTDILIMAAHHRNIFRKNLYWEDSALLQPVQFLFSFIKFIS